MSLKRNTHVAQILCYNLKSSDCRSNLLADEFELAFICLVVCLKRPHNTACYPDCLIPRHDCTPPPGMAAAPRSHHSTRYGSPTRCVRPSRHGRPARNGQSACRGRAPRYSCPPLQALPPPPRQRHPSRFNTNSYVYLTDDFKLNQKSHVSTKDILAPTIPDRGLRLGPLLFCGMYITRYFGDQRRMYTLVLT